MFSVVCVLLVEILCFGCTFSDPNVVSKDARIVEGTDRVSGSGIDHTLTYVTPSGFYGPEALYLLHGLCFTDTVDRGKAYPNRCLGLLARGHLLQSLFMHAPAPLTLLHVGLLQPETQTDGATPTFPYQIMEYGRGQSCGHSTRKVSVALVEAYDYGIIGEVEEKPTCTFFLRFGIPFSMETLSINIMKRPADQEDAEVKSDQVDEKQHDVKPLPKVSPTAVEQTCPQRSLSTDKIVAAVDSLATKLVESQAQLASLQTMVAQLRKDALDANPSSN